MKLRIPLIIFTLGLISGITQQFPQIYLLQQNFFIYNLQFFLMIGLVIFALEKCGINEKKVHVMLGVIIIICGILIDYFL